MDTKSETSETQEASTTADTKQLSDNGISRMQQPASDFNQAEASDQQDNATLLSQIEHSDQDSSSDKSNLNDPSLATVHLKKGPEYLENKETEGRTIHLRDGDPTKKKPETDLSDEDQEGRIKPPKGFRPGGPER